MAMPFSDLHLNFWLLQHFFCKRLHDKFNGVFLIEEFYFLNRWDYWVVPMKTSDFQDWNINTTFYV